ncbi:hypothetical protein STEG23_012313, partial [Scotinomys teguina]
MNSENTRQNHNSNPKPAFSVVLHTITDSYLHDSHDANSCAYIDSGLQIPKTCGKVSLKRI